MKIINNIKIKKYICVTMALILAVDVFTGCGAHKQTNNQGGTFLENGIKDSQGFRDNIYKTMEVYDVSPDSRMVYDDSDFIYDGIADNSQPFEGNLFFFSFKDKPEKTGSFTAVADADGNLEIICSKSQCSHRDKSCHAYINMIGDYFTIDEKLYFYSPWKHEYGDDPMDGEGDRIRLFSVTEEGKSVFCEIAGYKGNEKSSVITDGNDLYLTANKTDDINTYLIKIDMQTADYTVVATMPTGLIRYKLSDITVDNKQIIYTACDKTDYDYVIGVYSFETDEFTVTKKLISDKYRQADGYVFSGDVTIYGNYIYDIDVNGCLSRQKIGQANMYVLFEDLNKTLGQGYYFKMGHTYNNKMIITRHIDNGTKYGFEEYYVLDMETLNLTPMFIYSDSAGVMTQARIYAVNENYFLMALKDGYNNNAYMNEMAIISKENFYNDIPDFQSLGILHTW